MDELSGLLAELGFGEYEARAYVALLQQNPANGYELARQSGLPRGSIYGVLARLEEKGAVVRIDEAEGTRYAPVPATEMLDRLAGRFERTRGAAERKLAALAAPPQPDQVWTARGYLSVIDHARSLADSASSGLSLAVWPQEAALLSREVAGAAERGVEIRTLCLANCPQECGHCRGHVYRYPVLPEHDERWLLLIPDSREVLAGEITEGVSGESTAAASAVRTQQRLLVDLAESYIRQSTALAALIADLGPELAQHLTPTTRDVLTSLAPPALGTGWLASLRSLAQADNSAGSESQ